MPEYGVTMWIDSHAHLSDPRFGNTLETHFLSSKKLGIAHWFLGGVGPEDWKRQTELKEKFPKEVTLCFGLHPWWISEHDEGSISAAFAELEKNFSSAPLFGELGLDGVKRFRDEAIQAKQSRWFSKQLELVRTNPRPLVLHVVREHEKALAHLKPHGPWTGLVHSFSGSWEIAKRYLDLGFLLSVSANITHENHDKVRKAAANIPTDRLVVETDCPDQPPAGLTVNDPSQLITVAKTLGNLRGESWEQILTQSAKNLTNLVDL